MQQWRLEKGKEKRMEGLHSFFVSPSPVQHMSQQILSTGLGKRSRQWRKKSKGKRAVNLPLAKAPHKGSKTILRGNPAWEKIWDAAQENRTWWNKRQSWFGVLNSLIPLLPGSHDFEWNINTASDASSLQGQSAARQGVKRLFIWTANEGLERQSWFWGFSSTAEAHICLDTQGMTWRASLHFGRRGVVC